MNQRRRTTRRIVARVGVFLLLGAIINVAVAWGLVLLDRMNYQLLETSEGASSRYRDSESGGYYVGRWYTEGGWRIVIGREKDYRPWMASDYTAIIEEMTPSWEFHFLHGPNLEDFASDEVLNDQHLWDESTIDIRGLPCLSVWGAVCAQWGEPASDPVARLAVHGVVPLDQYSLKSRNYYLMRNSSYPWFLPYLPVWPGFAVNTIFYAAIFWLLFAIPGWLRRRRRIKRGLCPACGYDLRASGGNCPECGAAIRVFKPVNG